MCEPTSAFTDSYLSKFAGQYCIDVLHHLLLDIRKHLGQALVYRANSLDEFDTTDSSCTSDSTVYELCHIFEFGKFLTTGLLCSVSEILVYRDTDS